MARRQNRTEEEYEPTESGFSKQEKGDPELQREREEKLKALEAARLQIEKQFGQGALMKLGAHTIAQGIEVIPSGSILLDEALGIGGYPRGRIIEIYGPESSGKTTLALHAIAEAQKEDASPHSSMPNMPWTLSMPEISVSIPKNSISRSPTMENRPWTLRSPLSVPALWTSSS